VAALLQVGLLPVLMVSLRAEKRDRSPPGRVILLLLPSLLQGLPAFTMTGPWTAATCAGFVMMRRPRTGVSGMLLATGSVLMGPCTGTAFARMNRGGGGAGSAG
jgi:hypothetical protein